MGARIPPIQCLLTFEALARLRSRAPAADELCVTPSAVSHRVRQLECMSASSSSAAATSPSRRRRGYLAHVRDRPGGPAGVPDRDGARATQLRLAVTPTFAARC